MSDFFNLKTDGGAMGDGVADDTAALAAGAAAINSGRSVYMPQGRYKKTAEIAAISTVTGARWVGEGSYSSIIVPTGVGVNGLVLGGNSCIAGFEDFGIEGTAGTGAGISSPANTEVYNCHWKNLYIDAGSHAVSVLQHFSHRLTNIQASSWAGHGFRLRGANTVELGNCYAQLIRSPSKAGFRIGSNASLRGCNGVDQGDYWGIFGADTGDADFGTVIYPAVHLDGCNIEDFGFEGIRYLREHKKCSITNTTFLAKAAGSFNCHIHAYSGYAPNGFTLRLNGTSFETKGATRAQPSNIVTDWSPLDAVGIGLDDNDYYAFDQHAIKRFHNFRARALDLPAIAVVNPADGKKSAWVDTKNILSRGT